MIKEHLSECDKLVREHGAKGTVGIGAMQAKSTALLALATLKR
jgi:hypothetical protein